MENKNNKNFMSDILDERKLKTDFAYFCISSCDLSELIEESFNLNSTKEIDMLFLNKIQEYKGQLLHLYRSYKNYLENGIKEIENSNTKSNERGFLALEKMFYEDYQSQLKLARTMFDDTYGLLEKTEIMLKNARNFNGSESQKNK